MTAIKKIMEFIRQKEKTSIWHDGKLLMEFESNEPKEIIFTMDKRAELLTFKNSEHETDS